MIDKLASRVDHVCFRRVICPESIRDLVAVIFENRERQMLFSRMRLHFGCRFSRVRIDADHVDTLGLIILGQLLHSLVIAVRHRTTGGDEDNDRAIFALERIQRVLRAISVGQFEIVDHRANRGRRRQVAGVAAAAGDGSQSYDQKRSDKKRNRILLLHVCELLFKKWVALESQD